MFGVILAGPVADRVREMLYPRLYCPCCCAALYDHTGPAAFAGSAAIWRPVSARSMYPLAQHLAVLHDGDELVGRANCKTPSPRTRRQAFTQQFR